MEKVLTVYITKYALTKGIIQCEAECDNDEGVIRRLDNNWNPYVHKPFWHESKESAIEHAVKIRNVKVKSLEKQIAKLNALTFKEDT